jgi:hypothetical protein
MSIPTITINLDKKCAECRQAGAAPSGICLKCSTKAMDQNRKMKSAEGRAVQARWRALLPRGNK